MEGINKKLLWSTLILAAVLIGILSFLAGSYFGKTHGSFFGGGTGNTPSSASAGTPEQSARSAEEILLGQMFWSDPDQTIGLAVSSEKDIRFLMNGETFLLDQLVFFEPEQIGGDWMNCALEMYSLTDGHVIDVGLYVTEMDEIGAFINTFCDDVRTTMYPSLKNPFAKYAS